MPLSAAWHSLCRTNSYCPRSIFPALRRTHTTPHHISGIKCSHCGGFFLHHELISYRYSSCCSSAFSSCWGDLLKTLCSVVSNRTGMKFGRNVPQVNRHRLMELNFDFQLQDGSHDVISRRKVLQPGECTRNICQAPMQQRPPVPDL